jgi:hypothetical protein
MAKKSDKVEVEKRIRIIQEWLMQGQTTFDIIRQSVSSWGISERQSYRLLERAYDEFSQLKQRGTKRRLNYHIEARLKLFRDMKDKATPKGARAACMILDSMAKLEGVLIDKHEITGKDGQPIETTQTVVILPSNGHETQESKE